MGGLGGLGGAPPGGRFSVGQFWVGKGKKEKRGAKKGGGPGPRPVLLDVALFWGPWVRKKTKRGGRPKGKVGGKVPARLEGGGGGGGGRARGGGGGGGGAWAWPVFSFFGFEGKKFGGKNVFHYQKKKNGRGNPGPGPFSLPDH